MVSVDEGLADRVIRRSRCVSPFPLALIFLLTLPAPALAYVDPGSGMLLWQGLLAILGAIIVFSRTPARLVKALWTRTFGRR